MRSPSTVSTMRTVPCIAGCDGPMLTVIKSGGSSVSVSDRSWTSLRPRTSWRRSAMVPLDRIDDEVVAAHERLPLLLGVVLAERVADELFVEVDPAQVRVPLELDAVHVEGLALLPVERGPQLGERRQARVAFGQLDLEADAVAVRERAELVGDGEARLALVPVLA